MHKAKKRKLEPVEPLQPPPAAMNLDELPADYNTMGKGLPGGDRPDVA